VPAVTASPLGFLPDLARTWHEGANHAGAERASARSGILPSMSAIGPLAGNLLPHAGRRSCMRTRMVLATIIIAFTGVVGCSYGAEDTSTPDDDAECNDHDLERFMSEMGNLGITYDYDPSESPVHLREMADLVVEGALVDLTEAADELVFTVNIAEVLKGDPSGESHEIQFAEGFNPAERNFGDIADGFTPGLRGLFFLVSRPSEQPAPWSPLTEGLWLACERPTPQVALLEPSWQVSSLHS
jgi:hypothetical protein